MIRKILEEHEPERRRGKPADCIDLGGLVLSGLFILFILPTVVMIGEGRHE